MLSANQLNHWTAVFPGCYVFLHKRFFPLIQRFLLSQILLVLLLSKLPNFDHGLVLLFVVLHSLSTVNLDQLACVLQSQTLTWKDLCKFNKESRLSWNLNLFVHLANAIERAG
jgi:hypothetical protein